MELYFILKWFLTDSCAISIPKVRLTFRINLRISNLKICNLKRNDKCTCGKPAPCSSTDIRRCIISNYKHKTTLFIHTFYNFHSLRKKQNAASWHCNIQALRNTTYLQRALPCACSKAFPHYRGYSEIDNGITHKPPFLCIFSRHGESVNLEIDVRKYTRDEELQYVRMM
jgi:hypothetical protein